MELWESAVRELCGMPALLWLAIQDKRYLGISRIGLAVASVMLLFAGCFGKVEWDSRLGGASVGGLFLMFAYFSKEAIGIADGIVILVCGVAFGLYEAVTLCFFATMYAGCFSLVLLLVKKAGKKSRIPFLPFLLLGYVTMRIFVCSV